MKKLVARALANRIKDGETIGLGSGSTVEAAIEAIGARIKRDKLNISGVPTSHRVAMIAAEAGITVLAPINCREVAWAFDGADEVDPAFNMIKGQGAAMLNEKIMARAAREFVIIVGEDKLVEKLGVKFPIPVEVIPEAVNLVRRELEQLGAREVILRDGGNKYGPLITEHNNLVLDSWFDDITPDYEDKIKQITGVVESGLFIDCPQEIMVAKKDGVWSMKRKAGQVVEELIEKVA